MGTRKIVRYLGLVLLILGGFMATAIPWALVDEEHPNAVFPWLIAVASTLGTGIGCSIYGRSRGQGAGDREGVEAEISRREALVIVTFSWVMCGVFSGIPLLLDGMVTRPVDALFEAISGFTTTGSTILTDIESNSLPALWWRSMIQWLGGMGIIVLFVAVLGQVGSGGRRLFENEAPGPTKDQLRPRIRETGLALWKIYSGMTVVLFVLLFLEGMSGFDAACHAMTTLASGGFSTKNASIGAFDSPLIELTIAAFMLLTGINFGIYYALQRGRSLVAFRDRELAVYLGLVGVATLIVSTSLLGRTEGDLFEAFRYGTFQVVAVVSSTGFSTDDFNIYPPLSRTLLFCLIFIGGMGGSTAGGFKVSRAVILASAAVHEIRHVVHPRAVFSTRIGQRIIEDQVVQSVLAMFVIGVASLAVGSVVLGALGLPFETALSASMTALFNGGPGLNELGPAGNFAGLPDLGKLLLCALMIIGRLEFYTVLALLSVGFWRGK